MPCVTTLDPSYIKNSFVITFCIRKTIEVVANTMLGMTDVVELAADLIVGFAEVCHLVMLSPF